MDSELLIGDYSVQNTNFFSFVRHWVESETKKRALPKGRTRGGGGAICFWPDYFLPSVDCIGSCVMTKVTLVIGKTTSLM